ncbi:hypothetical protein LCGC14_2341640 [marine sediment metagenome]|uniref:Uncharacterized protein n=1 Tax=marine sediment metagenome TaxID=412755 RepID=A0A0F9F6Z4_9ZZZZ
MFNLQAFLNDLVVKQDDEELEKSLDIVQLTAILCNDPWLTRQAYYGMAGAMERQIVYLGETLLPNTESRISRMASTGIIGESYTQDSWFGTTNADDPHVNEEVSFDQQIDDAKTFAEQLRDRMRTAAIIFVTHVRAHDEISKSIEPPQLTYGQIKSKAEANRVAKQAQARTG